MGRRPIYGKTSHMWEVFPYMAKLPIYGNTSHIWEDFPYMGRLPIYGKISYIWLVAMNPRPFGDASMASSVPGWILSRRKSGKIVLITSRRTTCAIT